MAYLVTGGTGFIGSYVVQDLLSKGEKVVCLDPSGMTPVFKEVVGKDNTDKVTIVRGDLANTLQLFNVIHEYDIKRIIHLAYVLAPVCERELAYALQANCGGMSNILEAARLFKLEKIVSAGAGAVFGRLGEWYKETMKDDPVCYHLPTFYAATKALNEVMSRLYFEKFGVDSVILRLTAIFGIGKWTGVMASFIDFLKKSALNIPVTRGAGDKVWGYTYVEDLSQLIVQTCEAPVTRTRAFNIAAGEYTLHQIRDIILKLNPEAQVTVEGGTGGHSWLPRLDTTGVRTELGWQPKYGVEEGLRKTMNYFRQQEGLPLL